ncbi:MAG: hypothetical protein H0V60_07980 [Actinobacteria bacterium]|nr:hypothetical protein [Actinomycetota bacterium]
MEQPQNNSGLNSRDQHREPSPAPPLSPVQGFLLCLALLVGAGLVIHFTAGSTAPPAPLNLDKSEPGGAERAGIPEAKSKDKEPNRKSTLSNQEAVATFRHFERRIAAAYRRRNPDLVRDTFTSDSPMEPRLLKEIRQLRKDNVLIKPRSATKSLSMADKSRRRIELLQVVVSAYRFFDESGENVTVGRAANRDVVKSVLRRENGRWLLHNSVVVRRREIKPGEST